MEAFEWVAEGVVRRWVMRVLSPFSSFWGLGVRVRVRVYCFQFFRGFLL